MVARACNPSYSGGWGRRIAWTQEVEVAVPRSCHCTPAWVTRAKLRLQCVYIYICIFFLYFLSTHFPWLMNATARRTPWLDSLKTVFHVQNQGWCPVGSWLSLGQRMHWVSRSARASVAATGQVGLSTGKEVSEAEAILLKSSMNFNFNFNQWKCKNWYTVKNNFI